MVERDAEESPGDALLHRANDATVAIDLETTGLTPDARDVQRNLAFGAIYGRPGVITRDAMRAALSEIRPVFLPPPPLEPAVLERIRHWGAEDNPHLSAAMQEIELLKRPPAAEVVVLKKRRISVRSSGPALETPKQ